MTRSSIAGLLCVSLVGLVLCGAGAGTGTGAQGSGAEGADERDLAAVSRQIDIMRLVIARSINRRFTSLLEARQPDDKSEGKSDSKPQAPAAAAQGAGAGADAARMLALYELTAAATMQRTQFTSHTRGFYAEGIGALFSSEIGTPLVAKAPGEDAEEAERERDEWDEARGEMTGTGREAYITEALVLERALAQGQYVVGRAAEASAWAIDEAFVEAAVDAALEMLGKHGLKVDALPDEEAYIVALRFDPDGALGSTNRSTLTLWNANHAGARSAASVHVVIRVPKSAVKRYGGEEPDVAALRRQAVITRY